MEITDEAAARNPDVATLAGMAVNLRGLCTNDLAMVAQSCEMLRKSPRLGIRAQATESYGTMLLIAGDRRAGLDQLEQAWDGYDQMGALARRIAVQQVLRQAGVRRQKWSQNRQDSDHKSLTGAERRVMYMLADGHTGRSAAKELGVSVNTVGSHVRSAYIKLGVQSRVQLINALRERGELD